MGWVSVAGPPEAEIISLAAALKFLRIPTDATGARLIPDPQDDDLVESLIVAARYYAEIYTGKSLAKKNYIQFLDSFPYFTDTIMSQMAYPPSYYALPRYSTTLWNYSQMIKVFYPPLREVSKIEVVGTDGTISNLTSGRDFQVDFATEPGRIFPMPGQNWPPVMYAANAVAIYFAAGYEVESAEEPSGDATASGVTEPETDEVDSAPSPPSQRPTYQIDRTVPQTVVMAIKQLVVHWYQNRDAVLVGAGAGGKHYALPHHVEALLDSERMIDFAPTRG